MQVLTNKTAVFLTTNFKVDGVMFVDDLKKNVPVANLMGKLVEFTISFASNALIIVVFVVFMLVEKGVTKKTQDKTSLRYRIDDAITK